MLCLSLSSAAQAQKLVVGVEDIPYSPYYDFNTTEALFSRVLLDQFAADTGHTITYVPLPIKQFSKWLLVHDIDFKFPDNKRWLAPGEEGYPANYYSHDIVYLRAGTAVLKKINNYQKITSESLVKSPALIQPFGGTELPLVK